MRDYWSKFNVLKYQWIRLDKLYKLMEIYIFLNFGIIFRINYNFYEIIVALGLCMRGRGGICADQHAF